MNDDTGRLRPAPQRSRKRKVTGSLAAILAAAALALGVVIGYVARGGPPEPALVTNTQEIPAVTVTSADPTP